MVFETQIGSLRTRLAGGQYALGRNTLENLIQLVEAHITSLPDSEKPSWEITLSYLQHCLAHLNVVITTGELKHRGPTLSTASFVVTI